MFIKNNDINSWYTWVLVYDIFTWLCYVLQCCYLDQNAIVLFKNEIVNVVGSMAQMVNAAYKSCFQLHKVFLITCNAHQCAFMDESSIRAYQMDEGKMAVFVLAIDLSIIAQDDRCAKCQDVTRHHPPVPPRAIAVYFVMWPPANGVL